MTDVFHFTEEDKLRIENAVKEVENTTSGEIVPYFEQRSDEYDEVPWRSAAVLGVTVAVCIGVLSYMWLLPEWMTPLNISLIMIAVMVVGYVVPYFFPKTRIMMVSKSKATRYVTQRAEQVFLEEGVYKTIERTGILFYISYDEHEVVVLGDEGINAKVSPEDWSHIVNMIINGIKTKKVVDGIVDAILACEKLLLDNGFHVRTDDRNELDDHLRL